jgi:hypothetical protein
MSQGARDFTSNESESDILFYFILEQYVAETQDSLLRYKRFSVFHSHITGAQTEEQYYNNFSITLLSLNRAPGKTF